MSVIKYTIKSSSTKEVEGLQNSFLTQHNFNQLSFQRFNEIKQAKIITK